MAVTILDYIGEGKRCPEGHLKHAVRYILNPEKTEQGLWTGGNVGRDADGVLEAMLDTKRDWQKLSGRQGYHFKISFKPGETMRKPPFVWYGTFANSIWEKIMITAFPFTMISRICTAISFLIP